jgi:hypothetical protein
MIRAVHRFGEAGGHTPSGSIACACFVFACRMMQHLKVTTQLFSEVAISYVPFFLPAEKKEQRDPETTS